MEISKDHLGKILNVVGGGVLVTCSAGNIKCANTVLCDLFQYSSGKMTEANLQIITDPDDMKSTKSLLNQVKNGSDVLEKLEKIYLKQDGSKFYALTRMKALVLEGEYYLVIFIDGFEQYHSARTRLDKRYRDIIEFSGDVLFIVDPNGNCTYVNEMSNQVTGLSTQETLETNYLDLVSPSHKEEVYKFFRNHF